MTALSAARATIKQDPTIVAYPMSVSAIYLGAMVCLDASGYAVEASDATALSDVIGVAVASNPGDAAAGLVDNSAGSAGDKTIDVESGKAFLFVATSITQAMVGDVMYVADDQTFDDTSTNKVAAGVLTKFVSTTSGWVLIPSHGLGTSSWKQAVKTVRSPVVNIDNGAGTTIDHCIFRPDIAITIREARIVYDTETAGTVAGANAKLGTTVGGNELVAATAYTNSAAVGAVTAMTLAIAAVAKDTPILFRHTGIAVTAAGEAHIEIDYTVDE